MKDVWILLMLFVTWVPLMYLIFRAFVPGKKGAKVVRFNDRPVTGTCRIVNLKKGVNV